MKIDNAKVLTITKDYYIMKSDQVIIIFPPIKLEDLLTYLRNLRYSYLISDFFNLNEFEMAEYKTPSSLSETKNRIENRRYGKDSADFKDYNTFATAFNMIKACAKLNVAIYAMKEKYYKEEMQRPHYSSYSNFNDSLIGRYWGNTTDEDALRIKSAANAIKEKIHYYSKKYTVDDFEEKFVNKFKYSVYSICKLFDVETRTLTERATDTGTNILFHVIAFVLFCLLFAFVAKCATGNL